MIEREKERIRARLVRNTDPQNFDELIRIAYRLNSPSDYAAASHFEGASQLPRSELEDILSNVQTLRAEAKQYVSESIARQVAKRGSPYSPQGLNNVRARYTAECNLPELNTLCQKLLRDVVSPGLLIAEKVGGVNAPSFYCLMSDGAYRLAVSQTPQNRSIKAMVFDPQRQKVLVAGVSHGSNLGADNCEGGDIDFELDYRFRASVPARGFIDSLSARGKRTSLVNDYSSFNDIIHDGTRVFRLCESNFETLIYREDRDPACDGVVYKVSTNGLHRLNALGIDPKGRWCYLEKAPLRYESRCEQHAQEPPRERSSVVGADTISNENGTLFTAPPSSIKHFVYFNGGLYVTSDAESIEGATVVKGNRLLVHANRLYVTTSDESRRIYDVLGDPSREFPLVSFPSVGDLVLASLPESFAKELVKNCGTKLDKYPSTPKRRPREY